MNKFPIGVFDSGIGGLTVLKHLIKILPNEDFVYLGDTARVPYGTRGSSTIIDFSLQDSKFLQNKNVKCIVVACSTASSYAVNKIKKETNLPVFDVVSEGSSYAALFSNAKSILVMGTSATIKSKSYEKKVLLKNPSFKISSVACPLLVPAIEEDSKDEKLINYLLNKYLSNIKVSPDVLILGCTHYPIIKDLIQNHVGKNTQMIDTGLPLALSLKKYLEKNLMQTSSKRKGNVELYLTDYSDVYVKNIQRFLNHKTKSIKKINLQ